MSNQPAVLGSDGVTRPYIGGQALIEGVMMRSPHAFAAVVRRRSGELVVREAPMVDLRRGVWSWPLLRGLAALLEALRLGSRSLRFSAEIYERDLEDEPANASAKKPTSPSLLSLLSLPIIALVTSEPEAPSSAPDSNGGGRSLLSIVSVVFAVGMFVVLPQAFATGTNAVLGLGLDMRDFRFQVLTGCAKVAILIGYMLAIRRMPEIYRVFQYHGAEHKSIYTYEAGQALTVENARGKTTLHPRCGTTFIVMVALVSVAFFTALAPLLPKTGLSPLTENVLFILLKLPFFPLITAVTFELQRLLARYATRGPLRVLLWPGFLVQKITTIEPEDAQLEVALGALAVTLGREHVGAAQAGSDRRYPSYAELVSGAAPAS
jgi:uncharacterized protein YqhQ